MKGSGIGFLAHGSILGGSEVLGPFGLPHSTWVKLLGVIEWLSLLLSSVDIIRVCKVLDEAGHLF